MMTHFVSRQTEQSIDVKKSAICTKWKYVHSGDASSDHERNNDCHNEVLQKGAKGIGFAGPRIVAAVEISIWLYVTTASVSSRIRFSPANSVSMECYAG